MIHNAIVKTIEELAGANMPSHQRPSIVFIGDPLMNIEQHQAKTPTEMSAKDYFLRKGYKVEWGGNPELVLDIKQAEEADHLWRHLRDVFAKAALGGFIVFLAAIPGHWPEAKNHFSIEFWKELVVRTGNKLQMAIIVSAYGNDVSGKEMIVCIQKMRMKFLTKKEFKSNVEGL